MPYNDTIDEDLVRAQAILNEGRGEPVVVPNPLEPDRPVSFPTGGTIHAKDTYAAYMLLQSFVEEIGRLQQQIKDIDRMRSLVFVEPLIAWAQQQPDGDGIEDGGTMLDWMTLVPRIIREHATMTERLRQSGGSTDEG